jgi:S-adenosylmethionine:tRNA ribosyltransferase-isomerase
MNLSDFDYNLPKELIAQYPLLQRDAARLLVLDRKSAKIEHRYFRDIVDYFALGEAFVLNDTKVLPSRLFGKRLSGGKAEVLLLRPKKDLKFEALIKPSRVKLNEKIIFDSKGLFCEVTAKNEVMFFAQDLAQIYKHGVMPLPPYIKRPPEDSDNSYYQTVYARNAGAVAAPTAGLHFTEKVIKDLKAKGIKIAYLTLHVGHATFKPVKCVDIKEHKMGSESFNIPLDSLNTINQTRTNSLRVCAVGTTSCRALETHAVSHQQCADTDLFIYPGFKFKVTDCLLTNFHLPKTTLFMLVCAFAGEKLTHKAYREAVENKYRFYSYGDAMLII